MGWNNIKKYKRRNNIETTKKSNSFEISIPSGTCEIPAGGYADVIIYTKNNEFVNSIYKNSATFVPNDSFDANQVKHGELIQTAMERVVSRQKIACMLWRSTAY